MGLRIKDLHTNFMCDVCSVYGVWCHGMDDPAECVFHIGTSGWTYEHWKEVFYPSGLPKKRWFEYYASVFSSVEINATFYRYFPDRVYQAWKDKVSSNFRYVLKVPRVITHLKHLLDVEYDIQRFIQSCSLLGDRLGMVLLQVAPGTPFDPIRLAKALQDFPDPGKVAVEFRHACWFNPQTEAFLRDIGVTYCNVDSPSCRLTSILTSHYAYIRLHGRKNWYSDSYSSEELAEVADVALDLSRKGARQVYIFFNNDFGGFAPANALAIMGLLRNRESLHHNLSP